MMLSAGKDGPERLFARGYVPGPKATGLPARRGTTAPLWGEGLPNGADQQLHENKRKESTVIRLDRRYIFNVDDIRGMRKNDC